MYDSVNPLAIPPTAQLVAGYVDGIFKWPQAGWDRFPNSIHVPIACFPTTNAGVVLDVETGCSSPYDAPAWVTRRRAAGVDPTVYVNRSNWPIVRQAFQSQGLPEPHYWLAAYDGMADIPAGTVAKQYANAAMAGGDYDLSVVADYWPGIDHNPTASATQEVVAQEDNMQVLMVGDGTDVRGKGAVYLTDGITKRWVPGPNDLAQLVQDLGVGGTPRIVPQSFLDAIVDIASLRETSPTRFAITGTAVAE